ncbi:MAG: DUF4231 domain-containing protein [Saprospiraceae bacterium]|nr:DUF4231 domain-containing protein [Saprospiraceae bacterium]MCF8251028.1 DUF4231 domain-containing protein [Saprospiraceae bacterium]MCF8281484.1 DUF4231 domain-containing protein [Bacteroidales bacterium]MCF8311625.1 DUF4231 domain-containing protein [Saprospiraceae bacterium]MCF8440966.1 DUF4231 domain-containing protein [Saprospiraceae bacterium]
MATTTITSESISPAMEKDYDPIQMLRDYLRDYKDAPGYLTNYIINRLGDQMIWYDNKSAYFKRKWEKYRKIVIILSASIPFLVGLIGLSFNGETNQYFDTAIKILVGTAGVVIAVLEGFNSLFKSQDLYIDYRVTSEQLKQEFSYFLGKGGDYIGLGNEDAFSKLVGNVEVIMANQNNRWAEVSRQKEKAEMAGEIQDAMQSFLEKHEVVKPKPKPMPPPAPPVVDAPPTEPEGDDAEEEPEV